MKLPLLHFPVLTLLVMAIATGTITQHVSAQLTDFEWTGNEAPGFWSADGNWRQIFGPSDPDGIPDNVSRAIFTDNVTTVRDGIRIFGGLSVLDLLVDDGADVVLRPEASFRAVTLRVGGDRTSTTSVLTLRPFGDLSAVQAPEIFLGRGRNTGAGGNNSLLILDNIAVLRNELIELSGTTSASGFTNLIIRNGGVLDSDQLLTHRITSGGGSAGTADILVTGSGSRLFATDASLFGGGGSSLRVLAGANVTIDSLGLGSGDSSARLLVSGSGSSYQGSTLSARSPGFAGNPTIHVSSGGSIQLDGNLNLTAATLTIENAASTVQVAQQITLNTNSTINVNNRGLLEASEAINFAASSLRIDNGIVRTPTLNFNTSSFGPSRIDLLGGGELILGPDSPLPSDRFFWTSGTVAFTGDTSINDGGPRDFRIVPRNSILRVDGQLTLGTEILEVLGTLRTDGLVTQTGTLLALEQGLFTGDSFVDAGHNFLVSGDANFQGDLTGGGSFTGSGNVSIGGLYTPGQDGLTGVEIDFGGDVGISGFGKVNLDIFGEDDFDRLDVNGSLFTIGDIEVLLAGGYMPMGGEVFDLLDASSFTFASGSELYLPTLANGLRWDTEQFQSSGILSIGVTAVPEPSSLALTTIFGGVYWLRRRRRIEPNTST